MQSIRQQKLLGLWLTEFLLVLYRYQVLNSFAYSVINMTECRLPINSRENSQVFWELYLVGAWERQLN